MNFPRALLAAAVVAATSCTVLLPLSSAQAATVKVDGDLCFISIGVQDMAAIRAELLDSNELSLSTISSLMGGTNPSMNLLIAELRNQALTKGTLDIDGLSLQGRNAWATYYDAGRNAGFTPNDLKAMIISAVLPEYLAVQLDREFTPKLVGKRAVSKADAEAFIEQIEAYPFGLGIDPGNSQFFNYTVSPRVGEGLTQAMVPFNVLIGGINEPFESCISQLTTNSNEPGGTDDPWGPIPVGGVPNSGSISFGSV